MVLIIRVDDGHSCLVRSPGFLLNVNLLLLVYLFERVTWKHVLAFISNHDGEEEVEAFFSVLITQWSVIIFLDFFLSSSFCLHDRCLCWTDALRYVIWLMNKSREFCRKRFIEIAENKQLPLLANILNIKVERHSH